MRKILLKTAFLLGMTPLLSSCAMLGMGYGNTGILTGGLVKGQFRVQLVECIGNASSQNVTAVMTVTNTGPNAYVYIGGNDGSLAIDGGGATAKPYNSAGQRYDLPSGVAVRVEVPRIEPVRPGTPMFQILRISFGTGHNNTVDFRNVPIAWTN